MRKLPLLALAFAAPAAFADIDTYMPMPTDFIPPAGAVEYCQASTERYRIAARNQEQGLTEELTAGLWKQSALDPIPGLDDAKVIHQVFTEYKGMSPGGVQTLVWAKCMNWVRTRVMAVAAAEKRVW